MGRAAHRYRGRFAPSPTGPLHFGSLFTALASYLDAKAHQGTWLVRIEDVDLPRNQPGASEKILHSLEKFGLHWDNSVIYQSQRSCYYQQAVDLLKEKNQLFYCTCSRKELAQHQPIYPGTCRSRKLPPNQDYAIRFIAPADTISFIDRRQGPCEQNIPQQVGDFVIQRKDHLYAYQLAVVVDDALQDITHIVRGNDLLDNTGRQIALQIALGYRQPDYLHLPIITNKSGQKLSKQSYAEAVEKHSPEPILCELLRFLGQPVSDNLRYGNVEEILQWAISHWDIHHIPNQNSISISR